MVWNTNEKRRRNYAIKQGRKRILLHHTSPVNVVDSGSETNSDTDSHFSETTHSLQLQPQSSSVNEVPQLLSNVVNTHNEHGLPMPIYIWKAPTHLDSSMADSAQEQQSEDEVEQEQEKLEFTVDLEGKVLWYINNYRLTREQGVGLLDIINSHVGQIIIRLPKYPKDLTDKATLTATSRRQHKFNNRFYLQTDNFIYIGIARTLQNLFLEYNSEFKNVETISLCFNTDGLPLSSEYNLLSICPRSQIFKYFKNSDRCKTLIERACERQQFAIQCTRRFIRVLKIFKNLTSRTPK